MLFVKGEILLVKMVDYSNAPRRDILCIDVRSFFASVEAVESRQHPLKAEIVVLSNPHLDGGLVLAASPLVKEKYGITTGSRKFDLPKKSAIQIVEPRMALYLDYNLRIQEIFKNYTAPADVHPYSSDECLLDVTHSHSLFGSTREIAWRIQKQIWDELHLVVAVGIGDNPLLSKLAMDNEAKHSKDTNYVAEWRYEDVNPKVWDIYPLSDMWGIGKRMEQNLNQIGIYTVYDLAQSDPMRLKKLYGVIGEQLFFHAHGLDNTVLAQKYIPKSQSYSKNQILDRDYKTQEEIEIVIHEMAEENAARLRKNQATASVIHLSVGFSEMVAEKGFSHQMSISATNSTKPLTEAFLTLFRRHYHGQPVRTLNLICGKITQQNYLQLNLLEPPDRTLGREELEKTVDYLRKKYGYTSVLHASSLLKGSTVLKRAKLLGGHKA